MFSSFDRETGTTLIESVIAIMLLTIGLIGLLSMQPQALRTNIQADYLGHAAMLLNRELSRNELWIMNPCNAVAAGTVTQDLYASGMTTAQSGDTRFTVTTTVISIGVNIWRVTVQVTWPINATGITESLIITRQEPFRFPSGCTGV